MNNLEESTKQSREARWATIGRAIADGSNREKWMQEAAILRRQEQDSADRQTQFSALARQIGDALRAGRDCGPLLDLLCDLRHQELG
ncbi:MAG: hypothetical protein WAN35_10890 [Terracidiphilus sp.]